VANAVDAALARVLSQGCWTPVEYFGISSSWETEVLDADAFASASPDKSRAGCAGSAGRAQPFQCSGSHRRRPTPGVDAGAACAALGVSKTSNGVWNCAARQAGVAVYDDFAHHPTAIATTIAGLRRKIGKARILAVLEPRSNTMKLGVMKDALPGAWPRPIWCTATAPNLSWNPASALAPLGQGSLP